MNKAIALHTNLSLLFTFLMGALIWGIKNITGFTKSKNLTLAMFILIVKKCIVDYL